MKVDAHPAQAEPCTSAPRMPVAIVGSGFGLYGYLPAFLDSGWGPALLPLRYRERFLGRPELQRHAHRIEWHGDELAALDAASGAAICQRPSDQVRWVAQCLRRPNLRVLLLEKPLAPDPARAAQLLAALVDSGREFRVGYLFRHTSWGRLLLESLRTAGTQQHLVIRWHFLAHHLLHDLHNWKRQDCMGGGALRFYGIHLVALLAEAGYVDVLRSCVEGPQPGQSDAWRAEFTGPGLPRCRVEVDARRLGQRFFVGYAPHSSDDTDCRAVVDCRTPFDDARTPTHAREDVRVPLLAELCIATSPGTRLAEIARHSAILNLWRAAEEQTRFLLGRPLGDGSTAAAASAAIAVPENGEARARDTAPGLHASPIPS